MPAPIIYSTTGAVLTAEEISFAQQVAASFAVDMRKQWIKLVRREDPLTGAIVEYHGYKGIAYVTPGGAVDYVSMLMPNPVPYRGVSIGLVDNGPLVRATYIGYGSPDLRTATVTLSVGGAVTETYVGTFQMWVDAAGVSHAVWSNWPSPASLPFGTLDVFPGGSFSPAGTAFNGEQTWQPGVRLSDTTFATPIPGYGVASAAAGGVITTRVMASDGTVLASEVQNEVDVAGVTHTRYAHMPTAWGWEGGDSTWMFDYDQNGNSYTFHHELHYTTPEDCIHPAPDVATFPGEPPGWTAHQQAGVAAFNTRRKNWFKKNSDEFIAALKTGFAAGAAGVTRPELQLGRLPESWEIQIKRDVDAQYDSYAPVNTIGRKTHRDILYTETAFSETVESDTSANLTQAGVKVTQREVTLSYTVGAEVRITSITGTLTQTVTVHINTQGNPELLSYKDEYFNWYNREEATLPIGIPAVTTAPYLEDRLTHRIGAVLNGIVQRGYNADSTTGAPSDPISDSIVYTPAFPAAYSTVVVTVPTFVSAWHADTKIVYAADGVGASNTLNDSALYGVTKIELTPVGLIANGSGVAASGESVGMFSAAEDGAQVEIYGTAVYNFDWQTGSLTFANWKPLHDDNGLEVASKTVDRPRGVLWSDAETNCVVTYRGLHWPDVITALKTRDRTLPTATSDYDRALYTLINAIKAG